MHEMKLKEQAHQLEIQKMNLDHQHKMEELRLKYHEVATHEKVENAKMGDSPERVDRFEKVTSALLDAIKARRGQVKPPGGGAA